jgi:rod shape-determining protein MreB and related proteins
MTDISVRDTEIHIRGRDTRLGRPKSAVLRPEHVAEALSDPIQDMAEFIQRALEELPPTISAGIVEKGIHLTGGGALLDRLDQELTRRVGVRFFVPENPMHCVINGTALMLQNLQQYEHLLIRP